MAIEILNIGNGKFAEYKIALINSQLKIFSFQTFIEYNDQIRICRTFKRWMSNFSEYSSFLQMKL